jgi:hypothetical protein
METFVSWWLLQNPHLVKDEARDGYAIPERLKMEAIMAQSDRAIRLKYGQVMLDAALKSQRHVMSHRQRFQTA